MVTKDEVIQKFRFYLEAQPDNESVGSVVFVTIKDGKLTERAARPATIVELQLWRLLIKEENDG